MEDYKIFCLFGFILISIIYVLINYNIRYKGKCILHDWEYRFSNGDYWKYNNRPYGRYLKENERYECRKCHKTKIK